MEAKAASVVRQEIQDAFGANRTASLLVTGTSMVPFLRHRKDWVLLKPVEGEPRVGQILLVSVGQRLVLHRLRRKKQGRYILNGDGQAGCEVVSPEQVEAVAYAVVRRSGRTIVCDGLLFRLLSMLWWPTRPLRPWLIPMGAAIKRTLKRSQNRD